jgi:hypothetical protein
VEWRADMQRAGFARNWYDYMWVEAPVLEKNKEIYGKELTVLE